MWKPVYHEYFRNEKFRSFALCPAVSFVASVTPMVFIGSHGFCGLGDLHGQCDGGALPLILGKPCSLDGVPLTMPNVFDIVIQLYSPYIYRKDDNVAYSCKIRRNVRRFARANPDGGKKAQGDENGRR